MSRIRLPSIPGRGLYTEEARRERLDWMRTRVHARGSVLLPDDLITEATGSPPDSSHHLEHLRRRYL